MEKAIRELGAEAPEHFLSMLLGITAGLRSRNDMVESAMGRLPDASSRWFMTCGYGFGVGALSVLDPEYTLHWDQIPAKFHSTVEMGVEFALEVGEVSTVERLIWEVEAMLDTATVVLQEQMAEIKSGLDEFDAKRQLH
jgi:hypothetical protein